MAFEFFTGSLTEPASTGNQVITGVGFQPKAIIFFWTTSVGVGFNGSNQHFIMGMGMATASTDEGAMGSSSKDNVSTTDSFRQPDNAVSIERVDKDGLALADADFITFGVDGFTIDWNTVTGSGVAIYDFICLGGADLTNAKVLSFASPTSIGEQAYTGVGFEPDFAMFVGVGANSPTLNATNAIWGLGAATSSSSRFAVSGSSRTTIPTSVTARRLTVDKCLDNINNDAAFVDADFVSFNADGFTLDYGTVRGDARYYLALCLKGGQYEVGIDTQNTSAASKDTSLGFTPVGVLFTHRHRVASTTIDANNRLSIGASDGTNERSVSVGDLDNVGTTECYNHRSTTKALVMADNSTPAVDAEADVTFGTNKFSSDWTTADAVARVFGYMAFGSAAAPSGNPWYYYHQMTAAGAA